MTPRSMLRTRAGVGRPVSPRGGSGLVSASLTALLLLLLLAPNGSAQTREEPRPPLIEREDTYDLSVGLEARSWEDERIEQAVGPVLVLRRSLVGPLRARVRVATLQADVAPDTEPVPSRMYFGTAGLEVAASFRMSPGVALQPGVHGILGMAVTDPKSPALATRSQNAWGGGGGVHLVFRQRWIIGIEYERMIVELEEPAEEGRPEAIRTSSDVFSLRLGLRF